MKKKTGTWNFAKEQPREHGCRACEHSPIGTCELAKREIPITYVLHNIRPTWCPLNRRKVKGV